MKKRNDTIAFLNILHTFWSNNGFLSKYILESEIKYRIFSKMAVFESIIPKVLLLNLCLIWRSQPAFFSFLFVALGGGKNSYSFLYTWRPFHRPLIHSHTENHQRHLQLPLAIGKKKKSLGAGLSFPNSKLSGSPRLQCSLYRHTTRTANSTRFSTDRLWKIFILFYILTAKTTYFCYVPLSFIFSTDFHTFYCLSLRCSKPAFFVTKTLSQIHNTQNEFQGSH